MKDNFGRYIHPGFDIVYCTRKGSSMTVYRATVKHVWDQCIEVQVPGRKRTTMLSVMSHVVVV